LLGKYHDPEVRQGVMGDEEKVEGEKLKEERAEKSRGKYAEGCLVWEDLQIKGV
jgi:hypothetical protein